MYSIVIPAHNEEAVIGRCLTALTATMSPGELEVLVVCNGCADRTAELARSFGDAVRVLETDTPSKSNALNLGDQAARGFPRFYIDADISVSLEAIRRVAAVLGEGRFLAAAPRVHFCMEGRNWWVRAFYRVWDLLPYFQAGMIGTGLYALSEAGRRRFDRFPSIISDDGYVRLLFAPEERTMVDSCSFTVTPPRTLWGLVKIKTRSRLGTYELKRLYPHLWRNENRDYRGTLKAILGRPSLWPAVPVYALVMTLARLKARARYHYGDRSHWDRDNTSRNGVQPS